MHSEFFAKFLLICAGLAAKLYSFLGHFDQYLNVKITSNKLYCNHVLYENDALYDAMLVTLHHTWSQLVMND